MCDDQDDRNKVSQINNKDEGENLLMMSAVICGNVSLVMIAAASTLRSCPKGNIGEDRNVATVKNIKNDKI